LEENEVHLIKKIKNETGLTYKELSEIIGYSENTLRQSISKETISIPLQKAIELYMETLKLNKELDKFKILEKAIQSIANKTY
jgi:transcriptional regulator with XRE-family HTH domain